MDQPKFRPVVHVIAIIDIVLSSMQLGWALQFLIFIADDFSGQNTINEYAADPWIRYFDSVGGFLATLSSSIQITAAVKILNATQQEKEPSKSRKLCRFWRRVTIFFLPILLCIVILLLNCHEAYEGKFTGYAFLLSFFLVSILIRCGSILFVHQFMRELRLISNSNPSISMPAHFLPGYSNTLESPPPTYEECVKIQC